MTKIYLILLILMLAVFSSACGGGDAPVSSEEQPSAEQIVGEEGGIPAAEGDDDAPHIPSIAQPEPEKQEANDDANTAADSNDEDNTDSSNLNQDDSLDDIPSPGDLDGIPSPNTYTLSGGYGPYPDPFVEYPDGHLAQLLSLQSAHLGYELDLAQLQQVLLSDYCLNIEDAYKLTINANLNPDLGDGFPFMAVDTEESYDSDLNTTIYTMYFSNLIVELRRADGDNQARIYYLENTASTVQGYSVVTNRGLKVGDTADTLFNLYPDAGLIQDNGYTQIYQHWPMIDGRYVQDSYMFFHIENNMLVKIEINNSLGQMPQPRIPHQGV